MARLITFTLFVALSVIVNAKTPAVSEYILPNGLKIIIKEDHRAPVAVAEIWYKVGSSYEPNGITGISHALEHMMFRGTKKYGHGALDKIIVENGGIHNASTSQDASFYLELLPADKLPIIFELEADRMRGLLLDEEGFAKEKQVILEERKMRTEDSPEEQTLERFNAVAFASNPYRTPVIGWMHDIQNLTATDLRGWYKKWYAPNNATLVVVGDVVPEQVFQLAKKHFGKLSGSKLPVIKPQQEIASLGKRALVVKVPAKVPTIFMGYNVPSLKTVDQKWKAYALDVVSAILSSGDSSRLPKELVRKQQIAAFASASYDLYSRLDGLFILNASPTAKHTTKDLEQSLLQQLKKLQTTAVDEEELQRVKNQIIAHKTYAKDFRMTQAQEIGQLETVGLSWQIAEQYGENIKAITPKQIQEVANEYFVDNKLTVAELQPQLITSNNAN
jgi:zinc protease